MDKKEFDSYDDSAEQQGRKAIGERKLGVKVKTEHMTPKEYRNFKADIWDGIERRPYIQNWESWTWEAPEAQIKALRIVDKKPKVIEKRQSDRRVKSARVEHKERREESRRQQDRLDVIA